jgi:glyoxylase-like metal-dependent hydrolase (beta-lactamase superfamily II)
MNSNYYQFDVGSFKCMAVSDGGHDYYLGAMFNNVPAEEVEEVLATRGLPINKIYTPYTCLYVDNGAQRILIDVGGGPIIPHAGKMRANLAAAGIDPETIEVIIITHAHGDHIGGLLDSDGNLAYPNAEYFIWGREWDFWLSDNAAEKAPEKHVNLARNWLPHIDEKVTFVEPGSEILPGIFGVDAAGHTPGHMALSIISQDSQLLHVSDTVLYPLHLEYPDWLPVFDILPDQASASKYRIFNRAAAEEALLFAHHFPPFPNLGTVAKQDKGWLWQPSQPGF